jgi:predicted permease
MFKNYLKVAFRNIIKQKGYSFINISGLAIGMTCCILIILWVQDELSFDRFHENGGNLYRVVENQYYAGNEVFPVAVTPGPLAETLKNDFPEIINSCRVTFRGRMLFQYGDNRFYESSGALADPSLFEMFSFPFVAGDPETAFPNLNSVVITREMAEKYFGEEDPVGKTLKVENRMEFTVTAVIENVPHNSHLQFSFLVPFEFLKQMGRSLDNWGSNSFYTYVQLQEGSSLETVNSKIVNVIKEHNEESVTEIYLQPLKRIHLHSDFTADIGGHGDIIYIRIFTIIAVFVLLIACINFMNLSTARSVNRSKEVGMRKVVGAGRLQIIRQFFGESILFTFIALALALVLVELLMPTFNRLSGKALSLEILGGNVFFILVAITLLTGIVSGSYPAFVLSSFQPVKVLKGITQSGVSGARFRKVLVVIQFALSIILIVSTLAVSKQLHFIQNKRLGFDKEHLLYIRLKGAFEENYETAKAEVQQAPGVLAVSATGQLPTYIGSSTSGFDWDGKNPEETILMHIASVDFDYTDVFKMEMASGRFFSKKLSSDTANAVVVNETAVKVMGMENPIGKRLEGFGKKGQIIGVLKDFHFKPIQKQIEPLVLAIIQDWRSYMLIRIQPENIPQTIAAVEDVWNKLNPAYPFEYRFLDEDFERMYRSEQRMGTLFQYFTFLAILISCMGLFGLASFVVEKRTKEIGIRKALGASVPGLVALLTKEFTKWVLAANIIAWPAAWYASDNWLQSFAYRTDLGIWIFVFSGILALSIAIATVSFQAVKAALSNPVKALRYE